MSTFGLKNATLEYFLLLFFCFCLMTIRTLLTYLAHVWFFHMTADVNTKLSPFLGNFRLNNLTQVSVLMHRVSVKAENQLL